jgi:hypothetical protein
MRIILDVDEDGIRDAVSRLEIRIEGAMAEVVYMVIWSCQDGLERVSVWKKPAVMMVVVSCGLGLGLAGELLLLLLLLLLLVSWRRAWVSLVPQEGSVRSMEGIQWMFCAVGRECVEEERDVP